ncbi:MAG: AbrB/MazE/SpoVT family DNA-binding domain-containing protein [Actinomycetota bacterium]
MRATIDGAGRIVIPKPLRDELELCSGDELEVELVEGTLAIRPFPAEMRVVADGPDVVIQPTGSPPVLRAAEARALAEQLRR